jgi:hypothetical protein
VRIRIVLALCAALVLTVGVTTASGESGGNSPNAKKCQKGGWMRLVGANGKTFKNQGACVSYGAKGGQYATGLIIPLGQTAVFSNPRIGPSGACDTNSWGYQLNLGANVTVATKPAGVCQAPGTAVGSGLTLGPFATATLLRVFLHDAGVPGRACDVTVYNDGPGGAVFGSNPWTVAFLDTNVCNAIPPGTPTLGGNNFNVTLTITSAGSNVQGTKKGHRKKP